jgi:hypothetical protein
MIFLESTCTHGQERRQRRTRTEDLSGGKHANVEWCCEFGHLQSSSQDVVKAPPGLQKQNDKPIQSEQQKPPSAVGYLS